MKGHIQQRGKDSWRLKFDLGRDPATGKRRTRYETVRGGKRKAQIELAKIIGEIDDRAFVDRSKITLEEHLRAWLASVAADVSAKTHERYTEIVTKHLIPALGAIRLQELATWQIREYYTAARTEGRKVTIRGKSVLRPPLSPTTVRHHHRLLVAALGQAVTDGSLRANVAAVKKLAPKAAKAEITVLDANQISLLLGAVTDTGLHLPVLVALATGMRRGEILALRWSDVDLDKASLQVARTLEQTAAALSFKAPKTASSRREISLPATAVAQLRRHRLQQAETLLKAGIRQGADTLICAGPAGEPLSPRDLTKRFAELVRRLKLKVRFHDLRHTHVSQLLAAGVNLKVVTERVGHASPAFTLKTYAHLVPGMQEDAAKRIDAALRTSLER